MSTSVREQMTEQELIDALYEVYVVDPALEIVEEGLKIAEAMGLLED